MLYQVSFGQVAGLYLKQKQATSHFLGVNFCQTGDAKLPALQAVDRLMKESWDRWMKDSDNVSTSVYLDISFRSYMVFLNFFLTCLTTWHAFWMSQLASSCLSTFRNFWHRTTVCDQAIAKASWSVVTMMPRKLLTTSPPSWCTCDLHGPFMPSSKRNHPALLGLSLVFSHLHEPILALMFRNQNIDNQTVKVIEEDSRRL